MPFYHKQGEVPHKRHTVFRKPNGELYAEELVSTEGFSSLYSLVYHCYPPTLVKHIEEPHSVEPKVAIKQNMKHRSFLCFNVDGADDYIDSRKVLLMNSDLHVGMAKPQQSM